MPTQFRSSAFLLLSYMSIRTRTQTRQMENTNIIARLKAEAESLGLPGTDIVQYVKEERKRLDEAEAEERKRLNEIEDDKKKRREEHEHELERIRLQVELNINSKATQRVPSNYSNYQQDKFKVKLPFLEDKDDLESYLRTFERAAKTQEWPDEEWAPRLGTLLKGKAQEVYVLMSDDDAADYDTLKNTLLNRFRLTAEEYRKNFRAARRQPGESMQ